MFATLMGLKSVSCTRVLGLLENRQLTVIDVNAHARWAKAHVPGARNLDPERFTVEQLPPDKSAALAFYCSNFMCRKAPNAARRAKAMGYGNVLVMSAGIQGWLSAGLPTATEATRRLVP